MDNISLLERTDLWQQERQEAIKALPRSGKAIQYLGKEFRVYPGTFLPFADSHPLVNNFHINPGESVLDVGTGSGVIAIFACYKGAGRVVAVDVNPSAIRSAKYNVRQHGFEHVVEVKQSCLFQQVGQDQFDVITANLPFRIKPAHDIVAQSQWDTDFKTNTGFFTEVGKYLKPNGRIYFSQANFGAIKEIKALAKAAGFSVHSLGSTVAKEVDKAGYAEFTVFLIKRMELESAI
ncbi:methyltransferase [Solimicrobium silvestre]|uniref:Methyltransferase small domain n=1 Tax=Solimicrobium silvestre TaxID=2099400 RepID=A0A2S9GXS7_9BURK|nr:methyltransferase [Solimicrobium silvestre]PRC92510.1 Methyltransferase small domain [Solimicrobium silvestre]